MYFYSYVFVEGTNNVRTYEHEPLSKFTTSTVRMVRYIVVVRADIISQPHSAALSPILACLSKNGDNVEVGVLRSALS